MARITENLQELLEKRAFVSVGTAARNGQPNSAPKFFFRAKGDHLYLIDYVVGRTVENIKQNPKVSVSFMDVERLDAYRVNGTAEVIESGRLFDKILQEWDKRLLQLTTDRVIEAVKTGKKHQHFELEMSKKFAVLKIRVESIIRIARTGDIWEETG